MTWTDVTLTDVDGKTIMLDFTEAGGSVAVDIEVDGKSSYGCELTDEQLVRIGNFFTHIMEKR